VKQDIGEIWYNLGLQSDTTTGRNAVVSAQISKAENDCTDAGGAVYDNVVRPLAGAYCCNNALTGQSPNTLGQGLAQQMRDNFIQEAKWAALRNGFSLEGKRWAMTLVND